MKKYLYIIAAALVAQLVTMHYASAIFTEETKAERKERERKEKKKEKKRKRDRYEDDGSTVREGFHEIGEGAGDVIAGTAAAIERPFDGDETPAERRRERREERRERREERRDDRYYDRRHEYPSVREGAREVAHGDVGEGVRETAHGIGADIRSVLP